MLDILKHPKLPLYLLISFCILLVGCGMALIITPQPPINFDFTNTPVFTMTSFEIFQVIVLKNLFATFLIISLGILGLRFIPAVCILYNGYTIGSSIVLLHNPAIVFATIFPHGYFEFPLLIFGGACSFIIIDGIKQTKLNAITLLTRHKNPAVRNILINYLFQPYILIIIPGVIVTAIIESTYSLWNLRILLGV